MSTDQWDPAQVVRIRMRVVDGWAEWSKPTTRDEAELHLSSAIWLACPIWRGRRVASAAIVIWTHI